jgi:hypothetical protein
MLQEFFERHRMNISNYLSISCLVILFGYITYSETVRPGGIDRISDDGVISPEYGATEHLQTISYAVPKEMTFAGETVPLSIPDVYERLDKELQINCYWHSNTIFMLKRANRWLPRMEKVLEEYGIPDDFKYLPLIESSLMNATSYREAVGYWQILASSGRELDLEITKEVDERYDPMKATVAACKYLKRSYRKFGNWTKVAASYDRGKAGVDRALEAQRVDSYYDLYLNEETSRYVFRILAIKEIAEHPQRYGFNIDPSHLYQPIPVRYVEVNETITDLVDFAKEHGTNYKLLKEHNPWLREGRLTVRRGKTYKIAIPV